jgi:predicted nucleotidyltransferase
MWKDEWVIFKSIIGSTAYGVAGPDSDVDVRGVFLPPTSLVLGLNKPNDTH